MPHPLIRRKLYQSIAPYISNSFDQGGYTSYTLIDNIPTIRINPYLDVFSGGINKSQWFALRSDQWTGKTPVFLLAKNTIWFGITTSMWLGCWSISPDTDSWNQFDNVSVGASDYQFSNNTVFPSGMIYIALWPMYPFSRTQRLVQTWTTNSLVSNTASSTNKIISYNTRLPVDGMNKTPSGLPYYALKVTNATVNTKNNGILTSRMHACEGMGGWGLEGAMDWLLTTSPEQKFLLDWFNVLVYPNIYPQNTWAGHSRMMWTDSNIDPNEKWDTTGTYEFIDAFKAAQITDSGGTVELGVDFHCYGSSGNPVGDVENGSLAANVAFKAEMIKFAPTYDFLVEAIPHGQPHWWSTALAAKLYLTQEMTLKKTLGVSNWKAYGSNTLKAITNLLAGGNFTQGPAVGSRDFNGTTDRIDWSNIFDTKGSPITISLWIRMDARPAAGTWAYMWLSHRAGDAAYGTVFAVTENGALDFFRSGTTELVGQSSTTFNTGAWHHLLITHDGVMTTTASIHLYVDGIECAYVAGANGAGEYAASGKWSTGGRIYSDTRNVDGKIAQLAVWNSALSGANIALLSSNIVYAPSLITPLPSFYFKGNISDLHDTITNTLGVADGTTQLTGVGNGPSIIYP